MATTLGKDAAADVTSLQPQKTNYAAMAMVTTLFFAWGFLTCLNDILIPHLKSIFDLNYAKVMLVQFAFFGAYFVFSFPSGKIIDYFGYKRAMVIGLVVMGIGAMLFVPAAMVPSFPLFLCALITLAAGMTVLQTSANPYVAVLGPSRTASSRLNLTQAFNSLGTAVAPWFGSILIIGAAAAPVTVEILRTMSPSQLQAYRVSQAASVKEPYIGLAVALFVLAIIIAMFKLPTIASAEPASSPRRARNFCLRWRGSIHRQLPGELL
jgi:MFS transporter, FHS family, L-fucose permease